VNTSTPAAAGNENPHDERGKWLVVLRQLTEALKLLDESNAPPEVGAELDLAIHHLRRAIERAPQGGA